MCFLQIRLKIGPHTHPILVPVMEATSSKEGYETDTAIPTLLLQHHPSLPTCTRIGNETVTKRADVCALIPPVVDVKGAWPGRPPRLSSISTSSSSPCPQQPGHTHLGRERGRGERRQDRGLAGCDVTYHMQVIQAMLTSPVRPPTHQ